MHTNVQARAYYDEIRLSFYSVHYSTAVVKMSLNYSASVIDSFGGTCHSVVFTVGRLMKKWAKDCATLLEIARLNDDHSVRKQRKDGYNVVKMI